MSVAGRKEGLALAQALGISVDNLVRYTVHVRRDDVMRVRAVYLVRNAAGDLAQRVERLHLHAEPVRAPHTEGAA